MCFTCKLISPMLHFCKPRHKMIQTFFRKKKIILMWKQKAEGLTTYFLDEYVQQVVGEFKRQIFKRLLSNWCNLCLHEWSFYSNFLFLVTSVHTSMCLKVERNREKVNLVWWNCSSTPITSAFLHKAPCKFLGRLSNISDSRSYVHFLFIIVIYLLTSLLCCR